MRGKHEIAGAKNAVESGEEGGFRGGAAVEWGKENNRETDAESPGRGIREASGVEFLYSIAEMGDNGGVERYACILENESRGLRTGANA